MGHRDIWGKNPAKWKKQCPCFDAEKEYAFLDDMKLEKYADAMANATPDACASSKAGCDDTSESARPDLYVLDHPRDYTGLFNKIAPAQWMN